MTLAALGVVVAISLTAAQAQTYSFSTFAGFAGQQNANGTGSNAFLIAPAGTAVDARGNVYVADYANHTIQLITPAGAVTTFAGISGIAGSANGAGTAATFNHPQGVAVDSAANVYVADSGNHLIRMINGAGTVSTLAGSAGNPGTNDATGTNAQFYLPAAVAVDSATNVYVADYGNHTIRKITPAGAVTTLAGTPGIFGSTNGTGGGALFYQPQGVAVDSSGNIYVADTANDLIRKVTSLGLVTTIAGSAGNPGSADGPGTNALFNSPLGVTVDALGNVYVADSGNNTLRMVNAAGIVSTIAAAPGNIGSRDGSGPVAAFWGPAAITTDNTNLFVADYYNGTVRKSTTNGTVGTFAGSASGGSNDGTAKAARFSLPQGVATDTSGNIYVADSANNTIRKITAGGAVSTFAGTAGTAGSTDATGTNALFNGPAAVATDASGNIYVADAANNTIRKITSAGAVSTLAGVPGYANNADGLGTNAQFYRPQGIAVDRAGNIYVADTLNYTIRVVTPAGLVSTLAGTAGTSGSADGTNALFASPRGLALDSATNLYVADTLSHTIRQVTLAGVVTTIAGLAGVWGYTDGPNGNARFFSPQGVAVDGSGNVIVTDTGNQTIRMITPSGTNWVVTTIGGTAGINGWTDGGGSTAQFNFPSGIAVNSGGNFYITDSGNNTIRLMSVVPLFAINNVVVTPEFTGAFITWNTTQPAGSQALYGLTPGYGNLTALDSTLRMSHSVFLSGLATNTTYYFQINASAGTNQASATGSFSTVSPLIIQAPQASFTGVWTIGSSAPDKYSSYYKFASTVTGGDTAQAIYRPTITTPGNYDVYIWYSEGANRSVNMPVVVSYQNGSFATNINESVPGGTWQLLTAAQYFATGTNGFARLGNGTGETNKVVIADAVMFAYSAGQDSGGNGNVPAWWAEYYFGTNSVNGSALGANGYTLFADYELGLSPLDPSAALSLNIAPLNPGFQVTFSPWQGGRTYGLQGTAGIANASWTNVPNVSVGQNTNGFGVISFTNASSAAMYYRLTVQ